MYRKRRQGLVDLVSEDLLDCIAVEAADPVSGLARQLQKPVTNDVVIRRNRLGDLADLDHVCGFEIVFELTRER
jgi:hypothetical protein